MAHKNRNGVKFPSKFMREMKKTKEKEDKEHTCKQRNSRTKIQ